MKYLVKYHYMMADMPTYGAVEIEGNNSMEVINSFSKNIIAIEEEVKERKTSDVIIDSIEELSKMNWFKQLIIKLFRI
jgi:hypothetical protein